MREIRASLHGALRLAARDPRGLDRFNLTVAGFWRSFLAAVVALPLFFVERAVADGILAALDPENDASPFALDLLVFLFTLPLAALVLLGAAWILGRTDRFAVAVIALNWLSVLTLGAVCAAELLVLMAPRTLGLFMLAVYAAILVVEYRVVRIALAVEALPAIGVVAVTTLVGNLFPLSASRLFG